MSKTEKELASLKLVEQCYFKVLGVLLLKFFWIRNSYKRRNPSGPSAKTQMVNPTEVWREGFLHIFTLYFTN